MASSILVLNFFFNQLFVLFVHVKHWITNQRQQKSRPETEDTPTSGHEDESPAHQPQTTHRQKSLFRPKRPLVQRLGVDEQRTETEKKKKNITAEEKERTDDKLFIVLRNMFRWSKRIDCRRCCVKRQASLVMA